MISAGVWFRAAARSRIIWISLVGLVAVSLVAVFVYWQEKEREASVELLRTNAWVAWQVEKEYLRFLNALNNFQHEPSAGSLRELRLRFEIFYSRPLLALSGPESALIRSVDGVSQSFGRLTAVLDDLENDLETLALGNMEAVDRIRDELAPFADILGEVAMSASRGEIARQAGEQREKLRATSNWMLGSVVATAALLLSFLSFEAMRARGTAEREIRQRREVAMANVALQKSQALYRHLVESTGAVPYTLDLSRGVLDYIGPQAERILSYGRDDVAARRHWFAQIHRDDLEAVKAAHLRAAREGSDQELEYRLVLGTGRTCWFRDTMRTVREADGRIMGYGLLFDITHARRQEQLLTKAQNMESIGQLTNGLAHDFNNLLTVILGNAEFLAQQRLKKNNLAAAGLIRRAAERGAELIARLLAFSRTQAFDARPTEVGLVISGMQELLQRTLGEQIDVDFRIEEALWRARVEAPQLENAILNLCLNARDAMPGGGRLTIEAMNLKVDADEADLEGEVEPGDYVLVSVADTGIGMDDQTLARVFEPFFTTKESGKGSGLGLSVVYGFIKRSRGHIHVVSEPGRGTAFYLYLPRAHERPAKVFQRAQPELPEPSGSERLLVVEDNDLVRAHVSAQLADLGYDVVSASDGSDALQILGQTDVRLLFTDLVMPGGMTGWQLAKAARAIRPDLPVLFTSGHVAASPADDMELDDVRVLKKPYKRQELASLIRESLDAVSEARLS